MTAGFPEIALRRGPRVESGRADRRGIRTPCVSPSLLLLGGIEYLGILVHGYFLTDFALLVVLDGIRQLKREIGREGFRGGGATGARWLPLRSRKTGIVLGAPVLPL